MAKNKSKSERERKGERAKMAKGNWPSRDAVYKSMAMAWYGDISFATKLEHEHEHDQVQRI